MHVHVNNNLYKYIHINDTYTTHSTRRARELDDLKLREKERELYGPKEATRVRREVEDALEISDLTRAYQILDEARKKIRWVCCVVYVRVFCFVLCV